MAKGFRGEEARTAQEIYPGATEKYRLCPAACVTKSQFWDRRFFPSIAGVDAARVELAGKRSDHALPDVIALPCNGDSTARHRQARYPDRESRDPGRPGRRGKDNDRELYTFPAYKHVCLRDGTRSRADRSLRAIQRSGQRAFCVFTGAHGESQSATVPVEQSTHL